MLDLCLSLKVGVAAFALSTGMVMTTSTAFAKSAIALPSASLEDSLNALSRQTGAQILVDQRLLRGKKAAAVRQASSTEAALGELLRGSGLTWQKRGDAYLIVRNAERTQPTNEAAPAASRISAAAERAETRTVPSDLDSIVVTGSRIGRAEMKSAMPISTVELSNEESFGRTNIQDALAQNPAISLGAGLSSGLFEGWDAGMSSINLRNMGASRSLVMVDGKRRVSGSAQSSAVDLNMIPQALIERIEVVTGGAAAVYGADAVTGAVNIITKKDVSGLNLAFNNGVSKYGDGGEFTASLATGGRFADGRGYATIGATYRNVDAVINHERPFGNTRIIWAGNPANTGLNDGIPDFQPFEDFRHFYYAFEPTFEMAGQTYINKDGVTRVANYDRSESANRVGLPAGAGGDGRNILDYDQLRGPLEAFSVSTKFGYEITDSINYSLAFDYGRTKYKGTRYFYRDDQRSGMLGSYGSSVGHIDNPYMPEDMRQLLNANGLSSVKINRAYDNIPIMGDIHDRESITLLQGLNGGILGDLEWDIFYQFGRTKNDALATGIPVASHWATARDAVWDSTTNQIVCRSPEARANGCIPFNLFSSERLSQEQMDYVLHDRREVRTNTQHIFGGNIGGKAFRLPYGDISFVLGAEHRRESLVTKDDALGKSGEITHLMSGQGPRPELDEEMSVSEIYGEVLVPILADLPFAHRLEVEGAYRYSDYSTVGSTDTWKLAAIWSPMPGISFRGVRSRSVRTPNFAELFNPQSRSLAFSPLDPCVEQRYHLTEQRARNCAALGITEPLSFQSEGPFVVSGGNPNLKPETSNSLTFGLVLQPRAVPNLDLMIDFWQIKIDNIIASFNWTQTMNFCVDLPTIENVFCDAVDRGPDLRPSTIYTWLMNASKREASGIDFAGRYNFDLGGGNLSLNLQGSHLLKSSIQSVPGDASTILNYDGDYANARWRGTLSANYTIGKVNFGANTRFTSASKFNVNATKDQYSDNTVPSFIYNDFSVTFSPSKMHSLGIGVRNAFDVKPPFMPDIWVGARGLYDGIGRYFFINSKINF